MSEKAVLHEQRNNVSFLHKVGNSRSNQLFLMRGEDKGRAAWYYLMVDKLKLPMLQREIAANANNINLPKYGEVLKYGWGKEPPTSVVEYIEQTYC